MKKLIKKDLDYYLKLPYTIIIKPDEGGYFACIWELRGCIIDGETASEVLVNIEIAKELWLESAIKNGIEIPEPQDENFDTIRDYLRSYFKGLGNKNV